MSVAVMDGGIQIKRPWQEVSEHKSSSASSILPKSPSIPEINRALDSPLPIASSHRLHLISTTFEGQSPSHRSDVAASSHIVGPSPFQDSPNLSSEKPSKQARVGYHHTSVRPAPATQDGEELTSAEDPSTRQFLSFLSEERLRPSSYFSQHCTNCSNTEALISSVIFALLGLEREIKNSFTISKENHGEQEQDPVEVAKYGLKESLVWMSNSVFASSRMLRDVAVARPGAVASVERAPQLDPPGHHFMPVVSADTTLATETLHLDQPGEPGRRPPLSTLHLSDISGRAFATLPPILPLEQTKKGPAYDPGPPRPAPSPLCSSSGSIFGSMPSPMQSQHSGRTLPSPSTFHYPPSASAHSGAFSPTHSQAALATHLQDLQHQISTKTLALQTLQREHDQLLAAFSRSQIRCSTLDRKSQVSDHEINSLTEEKINLQQQLDSLESQVEELVKARDDAQKQSAADGAQWRQIVTMSSQLQAKGADETRRFKADKDAWERDRAGLQQRIQELEAGKLAVVASGASTGLATSVPPHDILASASLDILRQEIVRLRRSCTQMEDTLREIKRETDQIDTAVTTISDIRDRIKNTAQHGWQEQES